MKTNPRVKVDFVAKAEAAWGDELPGWVRAWAEEGNRTNGAKAAKRIGYSAAVFSHVLANNYAGDLARVEQKVNGALMGATVVCPIVGEIGRDRCLDEQAMPATGASSIRAKLFRACRNGCPHSRISKEAD